MRLFISYHTATSRDMASELDQALRAAGHQVWLDKAALRGGADWWEDILSGIEWCEAILCLLSPGYLASVPCMGELSYAFQWNKPRLPLMHRRIAAVPAQLNVDRVHIQDIEPLTPTAAAQVATASLPALQARLDRGDFRPPAARPSRLPLPPPPSVDGQTPEALYEMAMDAWDERDLTRALELLQRVLNLQDWMLSRRAAQQIPRVELEMDLARRHQAILRMAASATLRKQQEALLMFEEFLSECRSKGVDISPYQHPQEIMARIGPPPPPPLPVPKRPPSDKLLPAPFAWIDIPAGKVTLVENYFDGSYIKKGQKQSFDVPAFQIAKYPLTNAQFKLFIEADGYNQRGWWTDAGWEKREAEGWTEPRYWTDEEWNKANYPVVGVSWFEVVAYCQWLSEATGEAIRLPTEQEWQRAAQGDTKWAYPYGDKFDSSKCNFNTNGTTPVTQYEGKGDSPFKVVDMSGNVWEWCVTDYETGSQNRNIIANKRVLRGGSWVNDFDDWLRVDFRDWNAPDFRDIDIGCRLARS